MGWIREPSDSRSRRSHDEPTADLPLRLVEGH